MALVKRKTLHLVNSVIGPIAIADGQDRNAAASIQYISGGGTIVLEITLDDPFLADNSTPDPAAQWIILTLIDNTRTNVNSLAAAGFGWSEVVGARAVRCRLSVAAGADVIASLAVRIN